MCASVYVYMCMPASEPAPALSSLLPCSPARDVGVKVAIPKKNGPIPGTQRDDTNKWGRAKTDGLATTRLPGKHSRGVNNPPPPLNRPFEGRGRKKSNSKRMSETPKTFVRLRHSAALCRRSSANRSVASQARCIGGLGEEEQGDRSPRPNRPTQADRSYARNKHTRKKKRGGGEGVENRDMVSPKKKA
ncbi:hypothetical protein LX36DRAFT_20802 [Colletotrichum falcatum]|nr:hypothetical protein LX36DRAFT_20802 [Colletotrichum falcatum]